MPRRSFVIALSVALLLVAASLPLGSFGATLSVCPSGCTYSMPSGAYAAANAGDTIQIGSGTYTDCIYILKANLTLVGVGPTMPKMSGKVCGQKGILVTAARNITIRNLELADVTDNENYAGIRHDAAGFDLTLDNVYIHGCDDGLLGSASGDTITITNSRFTNNGMNAATGYAHNMYFGHHARVIFKNSSSTAAKMGGHEFKTRALRTEIIDSVIASLGGADSRLIDCSNGGTLIVKNTVLQHSQNSQNTDMIAWAPEGLQAGSDNQVIMSGNVVIGDRTPTTFLQFFSAMPAAITVSDNTFVAVQTIVSKFSFNGTNTIYASRTAAGYPAYPWLPTLTASLPFSSTGSAASSSSTGSAATSSTGSSVSSSSTGSSAKSSSSTGSSTTSSSSTGSSAKSSSSTGSPTTTSSSGSSAASSTASSVKSSSSSSSGADAAVGSSSGGSGGQDHVGGTSARASTEVFTHVALIVALAFALFIAH